MYSNSFKKFNIYCIFNVYLLPFDISHTFNAFINLKLNRCISLSANYRQQSGQVTTMPIYIVTMFGKTFKGYSNCIEYRLPNYMRLDLSLTIRNKEKPGKGYNSKWNFSIINITSHANISYGNFVSDEFTRIY